MADDDSGFDRSWGIEVRFWRGSLKNGYTHRELAIRTFGGTGDPSVILTQIELADTPIELQDTSTSTL